MTALVIVFWLALQIPIGILLGCLLYHRAIAAQSALNPELMPVPVWRRLRSNR